MDYGVWAISVVAALDFDIEQHHEVTACFRFLNWLAHATSMISAVAMSEIRLQRQFPLDPSGCNPRLLYSSDW
jgi:hypothetical protein